VSTATASTGTPPSAGRAWQGPGARERLALLRHTRGVAVVGASANPARASFFVTTCLASSSPYQLFFVNPAATEILGRPAYRSLADLPQAPDLVDVFHGGLHLAGFDTGVLSSRRSPR